MQPINEQRTRSGSQHIYTLTGDADAIKARSEELFRRYPPMGYGTKVTVYPDRTVVARWDSCE